MNQRSGDQRSTRTHRLLLLATALSAGPAADGLLAAQVPAAARPPAWRYLFDGESLNGWRITNFYKPGTLRVDPSFRDGVGAIRAKAGVFLTGITWENDDDLPRTDYEISVEAMKISGQDFFCGLTFPVGDSACSFIVGGWGGSVVGLSSVDDFDAAENETCQIREFAADRWYRIRVRVTAARITAWIDDEQLVDLEIDGRRLDVRAGEIEYSIPLGVAAYQTEAAWRGIRLRRL